MERRRNGRGGASSPPRCSGLPQGLLAGPGPANFIPGSSMRIALGLEYDGAAFCGWQTQHGGCGVQDHLETALAALANAPVEVTAAGRTDTGVHASAQVVHFHTEARPEATSWVRGPHPNPDETAPPL